MQFRRWIAAIVIGTLVAGLVLSARLTKAVRVPILKLDDVLYDSMYHLRPVERNRTQDVVILAVDQAALDRINTAAGYERGWPWPRKYWGSVVEYLIEDCKAKAVVFDMLFTERSVNPGEDNKSDDEHFAVAIDRARKENAAIVFAGHAHSDGKMTKFIPPVNPPAKLGAANISDNEKWRDYSPSKFGNPSLASAALQASGQSSKLDPTGKFLLHFYGPHESADGKKTFRYINAGNVVLVSYGEDEAKWDINKEMFKDKIVIIGGIATGLYDVKSSPLTAQMPGVEIQATAIENMLQGDQVHVLGFVTISWVTLLAAWMASSVVVLPRRAEFKLIGSMVILAGLVLIAGRLFIHQNIIWLPLAAPLLSLILTTIIAFAWSYLGEDRQARRLLKALSSVVSPTIAQELSRDPKKLTVGARRQEMTVMFTDIAGFTDLSETMPPEKLAPMLNFYLQEMSTLVLDELGTLDKYIGDAIMAFWNAPLLQKDHAQRACRVALRLVEKENEIQPKLVEMGAGKIYTRIGLNTGPMAVGFTGSTHLINYTVIGDSVNLGARLEGANKLYGTRIMIPQSTADLVKDLFVMRKLDLLRVKGKQQPIPVYELIGEAPATESTARRVRLYEAALILYQTQKWNAAESAFNIIMTEYPDDGPTKTMLKRIHEFQAHPPSSDWDGVYVAKDK